MNLKLVDPCVEFKAAFLRAVDDYVVHDPAFAVRYDAARADFDRYLDDLKSQQDPRKVPPDKVPQSFYWLINDQGDLCGISRLRHTLNEKLKICGGHVGYEVPPSFRNRGYATELLRLTLPKVRALGILRALITCDVDNLASARVIEKCGGIEDSRAIPDDRRVEQRRFWIDL